MSDFSDKTDHKADWQYLTTNGKTAKSIVYCGKEFSYGELLCVEKVSKLANHFYHLLTQFGHMVSLKYLNCSP